MSMTSTLLASGDGWHVSDVTCTAGPEERAFEETHAATSIAVVTSGTFKYRTTTGAALLAPGSLLLGNHGACFECSHEHGRGDRCLAFRFTPRFAEALMSAVPGARSLSFRSPSLPPQDVLLPLMTRAEIARDDNDTLALEEVALSLLGAVSTLTGRKFTTRSPSRLDEKRITGALRRIEARSQDKMTVEQLARDAAMSPFHFLRTFRRLAGMTPHQFILRTRLHRAAVQLRRTAGPISTIAYDCGFNDLSTFNRRFKRLIGTNPADFRARGAR